MSTSPKKDRRKRPIVKPSRYKTTSSDEAPSKRMMNSGGQQRNVTATMESDIRELRGILQQNSSLIYNNDVETPYTSNIHTTQPHTSTQIQYEPRTSTQTQYEIHTSSQAQCEQSEQDNQYPSLQTSINANPYSTAPHCNTSFTSFTPMATYNSTITSNQHNVSDSNTNTGNKFQGHFSNTGEQVRNTASYNAERVENVMENR